MIRGEVRIGWIWDVDLGWREEQQPLVPHRRDSWDDRSREDEDLESIWWATVAGSGPAIASRAGGMWTGSTILRAGCGECGRVCGKF